VVESGTHQELLVMGGHYAKLYRVQQMGIAHEEALVEV